MDLERQVVAAERASHPSCRVEIRSIKLFRRAQNREAPQVFAIDDSPIAPGAFRTHKNVALRFALTDMLQQVLDLHHDADRVAQLVLALHSDAEVAADLARGAVAGDKVL